MSVEPGRIVELWAAAADGPGGVGSGFVLEDGIVLTSRHVLSRAKDGCDVRPLGQREWLPAKIAWRGRGDCDIAVLKVDGLQATGPAPSLAKLGTTNPAPCVAVGFPLSQRKKVAG